jgi:anti-sigma factor RsiW
MMADRQPLTEQERADLVAYLDGELHGDAARAIEAKMSLRPDVRAEAQSLKRAWDLLDFLPRPEPTSQFTERTLSRLAVNRNTIAGGRWLMPIAWAAAVLVAFTAGWSGYAWLAPFRPGDRELVHDLRIIENYRLYEPAGDMSLLLQLCQPDLFGDEQAGS